MRLYVGKNIENELCFESIEEAKSYLKDNKTSDNAEVVIAEGRYFFKDTLRFDRDDVSATYRAEGKVYFDGGVIIDNNAVKKVSDKNVLERVIEEKA